MNEWIKKVLYIYNCTLVSLEEEVLSSATMMNLESLMLSEIPIKQIENDKNHMIALICRIQKEKEVKLIETQSRKVIARE